MSGIILPGDAALIEQVDRLENEHPERAVLLSLMDSAVRAPVAQPISSTCSRRYRARRSSGQRPVSVIKWIVLHSTEGDTAQGAAAWFANNDSRGSAHLCLDDRECYRTLADNQIPWGAAGANYYGFHIEQAGYARWPTLVWSTTHRQMFDRSAYKTALHCRKFGIRPYFVSAAGLRQGTPGVTTHKQCSDAFGGSHWDPGTGWPRYPYMLRVRQWYARLDHVELVG